MMMVAHIAGRASRGVGSARSAGQAAAAIVVAVRVLLRRRLLRRLIPLVREERNVQ